MRQIYEFILNKKKNYVYLALINYTGGEYL